METTISPWNIFKSGWVLLRENLVRFTTLALLSSIGYALLGVLSLIAPSPLVIGAVFVLSLLWSLVSAVAMVMVYQTALFGAGEFWADPRKALTVFISFWWVPCLAGIARLVAYLAFVVPGL